MKEKLNEHIQVLFADAERRSPDNQRLAELKEELLLNTQEKYGYMISMGKSPEAAYVAAINGIGDITELLNDVIGGEPIREESAGPVSAASPAPRAETDEADRDGGDCGIRDDRDDRDDREYDEDGADDENDKDEKCPRRSRWYGLVSGIIWTVVLVAYLAVSLVTHAWSITWLIFIMGIAADNVAKGIFDLRR